MNKTYLYSVSPIFFWVKGKLTLEKQKLILNTKDVFLGIPIGTFEEVIPYKKLSSLLIVRTLNKNIVITELVLLGFVLLAFNQNIAFIKNNMILMVISMIVFALFLPKTELIISKNGRKTIIDVPFFERKKIMKIEQDIRQKMY